MEVIFVLSLPLPIRLRFYRRYLVCLFVCLSAGLCKNFTKFSGKVAHGPRKKPIGQDFGGSSVRVRVGL